MPQGGPWEKYQAAPEDGPWKKYQASPESTGQRGAGSGRPQTAAPADNPPSDYGLGDLLPSGRSVLQTAGAAAGGVLGAPAGPAGIVGGGALGGATGESLYQLVQRFRGQGPVPQSSMDAAGEMLKAGAVGAAQEGLGVALPAAGKAVASRLYRTALKPSTALAPEAAARISDNLLANRLPIGESGLAKLNRGIEGWNSKIEATIATNPTAPIDAVRTANAVNPVIGDLAEKDLGRDLSAAAAEKQRFLDRHTTNVKYSPYGHTQISTLPPNSIGYTNPATIPPVSSYQTGEIPAETAQTMKKAIWEEVYPRDMPSGYKMARHAEGTDIRQQLEGLFPGIKDFNAEEGKLLEGRPVLERALNRTQNRDVMGIGGPITSGAVNVLTGSPKLAALAALAKNSGSRTAILLDQLASPQAGGRLVPAALSRFAVNPLLDRIRAYSASQ